MQIVIDDLAGPEIAAFLEDHLADMRSVSPPESKHALDLDGLRERVITFWTVWDDEQLIGCGALKELGGREGEIKSMRTGPASTRRGVASALLEHIVGVARGRGYRAVYLETGSMDFFAPARQLYLKHGFTFCEPFGEYQLDPHSVHMQLTL